MKIEILPRAKDDIIRQFEYYVVEHDAPRVAIRFREAVKETLSRLNVRPRIGAQLRCSIPGVRCWPVTGFPAIRIYYLLLGDIIRVVRILHGKRDVRRILTEESQSPRLD